MEIQNINVQTQMIIAIFASGFLSTIIIVVNDWAKDYFNTKKEKEKELYKIRETVRKEFLRNIDFIYKTNYLSEDERRKKKYNFLKTYRMMFLYLNDEEVKQINTMIDSIVEIKEEDDDLMKQKKKKIARSFLIFRKHVVNNTGLTEEDFKHIA